MHTPVPACATQRSGATEQRNLLHALLADTGELIGSDFKLNDISQELMAHGAGEGLPPMECLRVAQALAELVVSQSDIASKILKKLQQLYQHTYLLNVQRDEGGETDA